MAESKGSTMEQGELLELCVQFLSRNLTARLRGKEYYLFVGGKTVEGFEDFERFVCECHRVSNGKVSIDHKKLCEWVNSEPFPLSAILSSILQLNKLNALKRGVSLSELAEHKKEGIWKDHFMVLTTPELKVVYRLLSLSIFELSHRFGGFELDLSGSRINKRVKKLLARFKRTSLGKNRFSTLISEARACLLESLLTGTVGVDGNNKGGDTKEKDSMMKEYVDFFQKRLDTLWCEHFKMSGVELPCSPSPSKEQNVAFLSVYRSRFIEEKNNYDMRLLSCQRLQAFTRGCLVRRRRRRPSKVKAVMGL